MPTIVVSWLVLPMSLSEIIDRSTVMKAQVIFGSWQHMLPELLELFLVCGYIIQNAVFLYMNLYICHVSRTPKRTMKLWGKNKPGHI